MRAYPFVIVPLAALSASCGHVVDDVSLAPSNGVVTATDGGVSSEASPTRDASTTTPTKEPPTHVVCEHPPAIASRLVLAHLAAIEPPSSQILLDETHLLVVHIESSETERRKLVADVVDLAAARVTKSDALGLDVQRVERLETFGDGDAILSYDRDGAVEFRVFDHDAWTEPLRSVASDTVGATTIGDAVIVDDCRSEHASGWSRSTGWIPVDSLGPCAAAATIRHLAGGRLMETFGAGDDHVGFRLRSELAPWTAITSTDAAVGAVPIALDDGLLFVWREVIPGSMPRAEVRAQSWTFDGVGSPVVNLADGVGGALYVLPAPYEDIPYSTTQTVDGADVEWVALVGDCGAWDGCALRPVVRRFSSSAGWTAPLSVPFTATVHGSLTRDMPRVEETPLGPIIVAATSELGVNAVWFVPRVGSDFLAPIHVADAMRVEIAPMPIGLWWLFDAPPRVGVYDVVSRSVRMAPIPGLTNLPTNHGSHAFDGSFFDDPMHVATLFWVWPDSTHAPFLARWTGSGDVDVIDLHQTDDVSAVSSSLDMAKENGGSVLVTLNTLVTSAPSGWSRTHLHAWNGAGASDLLIAEPSRHALVQTVASGCGGAAVTIADPDDVGEYHTLEIAILR